MILASSLGVEGKSPKIIQNKKCMNDIQFFFSLTILKLRLMFFAQTGHLKHVLPQAAQLSMYTFSRKISWVAPPQGT